MLTKPTRIFYTCADDDMRIRIAAIFGSVGEVWTLVAYVQTLRSAHEQAHRRDARWMRSISERHPR
jgi:hypothetical protein